MHRNFLLTLVLLLAAVAPVWGYSHDWTFGPFIAVLFLLAVNLVVYLFAHGESDDAVVAPPAAKS